MARKVTGVLLKRSRYLGGTQPAVYFPADRSKMAALLGAADKVWLHARVYDRSGAGSPSIDFDVSHGCLPDQLPRDGLRKFTVSATDAASPSLRWNATNMTAVPDDGAVSYTPGMGLLDVAMLVSGNATTWVEVEVCYTAIYLQ